MAQQSKVFHQGSVHVGSVVLIDHPSFGKVDVVGRDYGKVGKVVQFYDEPGFEDCALVQVESFHVQVHVPSQMVKVIFF